MNRIIALDCASRLLVVGVAAGKQLAQVVVDAGVHHAEKLMPELDRLCRQLDGVDDQVRRCDLIVCGRGPGSFSGARVALATAKGLALALQAPFVLVSSLAAWFDPELEGTVVPVIDARRQCVYAQAFAADKSIGGPWDLPAAELLLRLRPFPQPWHFVGPDAQLLADLVDRQTSFCHPPATSRVVEQLMSLGGERWRQNGAEGVLSGPEYLRSAVSGVQSSATVAVCS